MFSVFGVFLLGWVTGIACVPLNEETSRSVDTSFIAKGTNEIASVLLKADVQKEDNLVYSPFGYSAILAVFSEGARGVSREEIANALYFPSDKQVVRQAYNSVLERFVGKKFTNSPEFKNWFYIYRNYTVEDELQNILRKYYLTEVKCVERPEDYIKHTKKTPIRVNMESNEKISMEESKIEKEESKPMDLKTEGLKSEKPMDIKTEGLKSEKPMDEKTEGLTNEKPMDGLKSEKPMEGSVKEEKPIKEEPKALERSSAQTEETQPIENSKYKGQEAISEMMDSGDSQKKLEEENSMADSDSQKKETEKTTADKKTVEMAPIKTKTEMGPMPVEHLSGMTDSSLTIRGEESTPRMVIFNGLYYKGEWETPFEKKPADDSRVFYKSDTEKIFVSTIHSQGVFNYGNIPNLDCRAIELPYRGGRYSLLILVPNSRSGLNKLISDLYGYPLRNIYGQLTEKQVDVCLPCFEINTISKPVASVRKLGLNKITSIFDPETADLSGISSKDSKLYVDELVQMVTFKVDATYSKANFLTASIASSRSNIQTFQINQPFLFYLRDNLEDLIIVNGKVIDPTPKPSFYFS